MSEEEEFDAWLRKAIIDAMPHVIEFVGCMNAASVVLNSWRPRLSEFHREPPESDSDP